MAGDIDKAKNALAAAGYRGERVVVLAPADFPSIYALAQVDADLLKKIGMTVDLQVMDWGTVVAAISPVCAGASPSSMMCAAASGKRNPMRVANRA